MRIDFTPQLHRLVRAIYAHPYAWFFSAILLAVAMGSFAIKVPGREGAGLKLKSAIQDLLPEHAPSVQAMGVLEKRLGSADILIVTLMTDDFEKVKAALPEIAKAVDNLPDVDRVEYRLDTSLLERNALTIFASLPELEDYYHELTERIREAVKQRLNLFGEEEGEEEGAAAKAEDPAKPAIRRTFSWAEFETDDGLSNLGRAFRTEKGNYREYFFNRAYTTIGLKVYPTRSSGDLDFCKKIIADVDQTIKTTVEAKLGPIGDTGVVKRVDLGGGYRNALEQSKGIQNDVFSSIYITFGLLALCIIIGFRSVRAFFCIILPLVIGAAWTLGLVALTVGYLNLITAFIFAVLMGLGIDFGIHYYGRYREERAVGHDNLEAMLITHTHSGSANMLAALTTAASFLALTLADFKGFSQFGGVAAAGVTLCLVSVIIVFTALMFILERWMPLKLLGYTVDREKGGDIPRKPFPLGAITVVVALGLAITGFVSAGLKVDFELDFGRLGEKTTKTSEVQELQYGTTTSSSPAVIFADSEKEARALYDQLEKRVDEAKGEHPRIKSYQALFALVPDHQPEKIEWVNKICRKLKRKVKLFEGDQRDGADELLRHCEPEPFSVAALPDWVKAKFSDRDGKLGEFIFVSPRGSTSDGAVAMAFRDEMLSLQGLDGEPPVVSGKPLIWAEVILAMKHDGLLTIAASLLVVLLLVIAFERTAYGTFMIMLPLTISMGFSAGLMALLGLKLNFFNMLALPTVIGMGVDDGIHMYHRYKHLGTNSAWYIFKTTGNSAFLTTLTTVIGFTSLMTANHYGLNSLGLLTNIGMALALMATLSVMPAAMSWTDKVRAARAARAAAKETAA